MKYSSLKKRRIYVFSLTAIRQRNYEIADFTGDSFQLSVMASKAEQKTVIMCGVRFMAETVKILSPEKTVFLGKFRLPAVRWRSKWTRNE